MNVTGTRDWRGPPASIAAQSVRYRYSKMGLLEGGMGPALKRHPLLVSGALAAAAALALRGCMRVCSTGAAAEATSRSKRLTVICSDMDGTLLPSGAYPRRISAANAAALKLAIQQGVKVIIATGKRPGPWLPPLRAALGFTDAGGMTLNAPSVMFNGLLVTDVDGTVAHKQLLPRDIVARLVGFGAEFNLSLHAYTDDDRNVCAAHDSWSEKVVVYEEPTLEAIGAVDMLALGDASTGSVGTFKLVWWGAAEDITAARPALDALVGGDAEVVSSLETALEVLPSGASKADGMAIALKLLGEDGPRNVLALGLC
jgi:hydroxymethylpyrimidine pyrophosphatase-like HAD family hydrolase